MTDTIIIRDLLARTVIGVEEHERRAPQEVLITLTLHTDTRPAGRSDRLEDAVNYHAVAERVLRLAETSSFFLVERLAEAIAAVCIQEFGVEQVQVKVEKPGALHFARSVGVTILRTAADFKI